MTADAYISQWSIGRRTLFDVLDTSAEKITAKKDFINAQYDEMYDSYRILSGLGKLVHTLGLQWPEESRIEASMRKGSKTEAPLTQKEVIVPKYEEPVTPKETVVAKIEEPVAPKETGVASAAPDVADKNIAPISSKQKEPKDIDEAAVQNLVNKWLTSWKSGDMEAYRSFYASDFKSKGMNLDDWISYKTDVHQKSKDVAISVDKLLISERDNDATAVFTQYYSSSIFKDSGKKTLKLRKINDEWKIYKEIM
jgi:ketosteroid isomerase-like protein